MGEPQSRFLGNSPRLHYLEWNSGASRTVVLAHGNSANAWWWRAAAEALAADGLRIVALDFRGHGDSEWVRPPAYSPADYADDLARLIESLRLAQPLVAGHSMGGVAVLAFALSHPKLARAAAAIDVAVTSSARRDRYLRRLKTLPTVGYPDIETAIARYRLMPDEGGYAPGVLREIAAKSIASAPGGGYTMKFDRESFFGGDGLDVADAIRRAPMPLLLVRAEHSRIMTAAAALAAAESNPLARLATIPSSHHHIPLERPRELARAIAAFDKSVCG
jgi:pimeloyl-ACP methyl ester carboxylesterase